MNRFFLTAFLFLCAGSVAAQYTMDRYHTKEGIANNRVAAYDILELKQHTDGTTDSLILETLTFDERGNLLSEFRTDISLLQTYAYDAEDRQISGTSSCPDIEREERHEFVYKKGLLVKKITYATDHGERTKDVVEYTYTNGLLTQEKVLYDSDRARYYTHSYDAEGRLVKTDLNGQGTEEFFYDAAGNLVEYRAKTSLSTVRDVFEYDGKLRTKQTIYTSGATDVFTMEYDANGLILRENGNVYRYRYR